MNKTKTIVFGLIGITLVSIYAIFDPADVSLFPSCPFPELTGWQCPGCGSQRAVHQLLHAEWSSAFHYNPLLIPALIYIAIGLIFDRIRDRGPSFLVWRKRLFGPIASRIVPIVIIGFWILRNVL